MLELDTFKSLSIALALGLLIGLERGWQGRELNEGQRIAGLRTFGLIALLGGLSALLAKQLDPLFLGFAFIGLSTILLVAYYHRLVKYQHFSVTATIAGLITFVLGALAVLDHRLLASAFAVIMTALLGFKPLLHAWLNKLEQHELEATLQLLLISVVVLPMLPNQGYGPWDFFNPYHTWWMVVLIAGISYLGYFANKIVGVQHGPVLTGAIGGLVSSTAVTLNLAKVAADFPQQENALAAGILTACATMFVRTLLLASIINVAVFQLLLLPLLVMSMITYGLAILCWYKASPMHALAEIKLKNPFQLLMALKFGGFLVLVMFMSLLLKHYFGDQGGYWLAALAGLADVDPVTLSMSQMSKSAEEVAVAARTILIAVSVNSGVKGIYAGSIGGTKLGVRVGGTLGTAVLAGLSVLWF